MEIVIFSVISFFVGYVLKVWLNKDNTSDQVGGGGSTGKPAVQKPDKK